MLSSNGKKSGLRRTRRKMDSFRSLEQARMKGRSILLLIRHHQRLGIKSKSPNPKPMSLRQLRIGTRILPLSLKSKRLKLTKVI